MKLTHTNRRIVQNVLFGILILLCSTSSQAQWIQCNGPFGGNVQSIVTSGSVMYAGLVNKLFPSYTTISTSQNEGFYRSTDNGNSWVKSDSGIPNKNIFVITVIDSTILVGTPSGIYRSTNRGVRWTEVLSLDVSYISSITATPNVICAMVFKPLVGAILYRSSDKGMNWGKVDLLPYGFTYLTSIDSVLFAGVRHIGVMKSMDNGTTWTETQNPIYSYPIIKAFDTTLFAFDGNEVFRYTQNSGPWVKISTGLQSLYINGISSGKNALYVFGTEMLSGKDVLYKSTDNGNLWVKLPTQLTGERVNCLEEIGNILFAGTAKSGIFKYGLDENSWALSSTGLAFKNCTSLYAHGKRLFAGTEDSRVYRSDSKGDSWELWTSLSDKNNIHCFVMDSNRLFVGSDSGVYRCIDSVGSKNASVSRMTTKKCSALCISGKTLLAGTSKGILLSLDNGSTWNPSNNGMYDSSITCLTKNNTAIFAGTDHEGMFRSMNDGSTWEQINVGLTNTRVHCILTLGSLVFVGTQVGVFTSVNSGITWTEVNTGIDTKNGIHTLAFAGTSLIAGSISGEVYRSLDSGSHWLPFSQGFSSDTLQALHSMENTIFAGTTNFGVHKVDVSPIGVSENSKYESRTPAQIRYYPSPASTSLLVHCTFDGENTAAPIHYTITSLTGQKLIEFDRAESRCTISTEALTSGVYSLSASQGLLHARVLFSVVK